MPNGSLCRCCCRDLQRASGARLLGTFGPRWAMLMAWHGRNAGFWQGYSRAFAFADLPDKPPPCPTRSPLSINSPRLPDFRELREPLRAICAGLKLKGSVLLAHEGINGTLAGEPEAIDELVDELRERRPVRRPARQSRTEILASRGDAVSAPESPAEKGDRHARRHDCRSDPAGRHLCRARRLERI